MVFLLLIIVFFFNDTATTEIYTLSLHDALPICHRSHEELQVRTEDVCHCAGFRSEEHTSELQSRPHLVCRLLLEKKNEHQESEPFHTRQLNERHATNLARQR